MIKVEWRNFRNKIFEARNKKKGRRRKKKNRCRQFIRLAQAIREVYRSQKGAKRNGRWEWAIKWPRNFGSWDEITFFLCVSRSSSYWWTVFLLNSASFIILFFLSQLFIDTRMKQRRAMPLMADVRDLILQFLAIIWTKIRIATFFCGLHSQFFMFIKGENLHKFGRRFWEPD